MAKRVNPTILMTWRVRSSRSSAVSPRSRSEKSTFRDTLAQGMSRKDWNTKPMSGPGRGGAPKTRTVPLSGWIRPSTSRSRVVFPHPDGPSRARNFPLPTDSEASCRAETRSPPPAGAKLLQTRSRTTRTSASPDRSAGSPADIIVTERPHLQQPRVPRSRHQPR